VAHIRTGALAVLFACGFGAAAFAQESQPPASPARPAAGPPAPQGKQSPHKKAGAARVTPAPNSGEAERAARLAEGRRKFFEQSTGFDNKGSDSPFSMGNGFTPSVGMKF
jgi:hypothetical protein